jgi:glycosyltransferase involved in cell wall biosynthesis
MNIGFFCYNLEGTGPRTRARDIINAVAEQTTHNVTVLTNQPELVSPEADAKKISLTNILKTAWTTRKAFSDSDIVQVPVNIYQVLFVRLFYRGPLVAGVGPGIQWRRPYRLLGKALDIDKKLIVHESQTEWEESGYDTEIVTATIDRDRFYPYTDAEMEATKEKLDVPKDESIILYVGELTEEKGAHIVDEMATKTQDDDQMKFIVIGEGPLRSQFEGRSDLRYEGFVDNDRMPLYYNVADIAVGPREDDNTSNVGLESIACGTPYVTTADGYIRDLFEESGTYVWAERDAESVLEVIKELLVDDEYYEAQVERGLETIETRPLTLDAALDVHLSVYEELT